jgi:hypothetical protein
MLDGGHHDVKTDDYEKLVARLWIDSGAPYPGTYAALGSGMIGGYERNTQVIENDRDWPETQAASAVIARRCVSCHSEQKLPMALSDETGFSFWMPDLGNKHIRRNRHIVFNLTHPEKSLMLLGPLSRSAGGHGTCREKDRAAGEGTVFTTTEDPDYQVILAMCRAGQRRLNEVKRFDMPGFKPRPEWVGEMKRMGILPKELDPDRTPIDIYATEKAYWDSLHYQPKPEPTQ